MTQTNLPLELSSFHGRDEELATVYRALDESRLVTLTGAGGAGKTRLALRVARNRIGQFGDGIWFVELAAVSRADGVAGAVARALDLREEASTPLTDTLVRELAGREALLILDNCEQVLEACAALTERLLKDVPRLRVLATSREHLGISGEFVRVVSPLGTEAGVALFHERARQAIPDFDPAKEQASIEAIVERLDGLPLAIELAAARIRVLNPSQILAGLDDRFRLLSGGAWGAAARQKTLEASVAWSYDLLDEDEQTLAQRLSVLHGFTLETAAVLGACEQIKAVHVLDTLSRLVDRSLVQVDQPGEEPRFRFLETVRQFLLIRLRDAGQLDVMAQQHMVHFLTLAEELSPRLALSDGPKCLSRLQVEFDNLEDALTCAAKLPDAANLLRLLVALSLFYELRGHFAHGSRWFELALSQDTTPSVLRARALWGAAHVCFYGGRYAVSATRAQQALEMAQEVDDEWSLARALNTTGVLQALSTPVLARENLLQSVSVGRSIGDDWAIADGLKMVTVAWYVLHDEDGAGPAMAELEAAGLALGSRFFLAWHQAMVGYFARDRGDLETAAKAFELSSVHSAYVGDPSTGGFAEAWSAALDADRGQIDRARVRLSRLLASATVAGSDLAVPEALFALGQLEVADGQPQEALHLVGSHVTELRDAGAPAWAAQLSIVLAAAHRSLGDLANARAALTEAETLGTPLKNPLIDGLIQFEGACLAFADDDMENTEDWLHEALAIQSVAGLRPGMLRSLETLAAAIVRRGKYVEAARILSATEAARNQLTLVRGRDEEKIYTALVAQLRQAIGPAEFEALKTETAAADLDEIVEYVSRMRGRRRRALTGWQSLTPTERRAVSLVVEGLTNPQIAERMFIARGTVKIHLAHVFGKLNVSTRTQLAAKAVSEGFDEQG